LSSNKTLYIDIDSTIWAPEPEYDKVEYAMYGTTRLSKEWFEPDELVEIYGPDFKQIFWKALAPEKVAEREMFPHVGETLDQLNFMGYNIHFLTHTHFPDEMRKPLHAWISECTLAPFEITPTEEANDKIDIIAEDPSAWGVIEDRVSTLTKAVEEGYYAFGKRTHVNDVDIPGVRWFDDWRLIPSKVRFAEAQDAWRVPA